MTGIRIGIIQSGPKHLDLAGSVDQAIDLINTTDAELLVFGESWLTGYPAWLDHGMNLNVWGDPAMKSAYEKLVSNSPSVDDPFISAIKEAANRNRKWVILGLHEKTDSQRSLFNSIIGISNTGQLVYHHRKMVPTFTEKLIHKPSENFDLSIMEVNGFRIGALICWEHWMPLSRQYYHDQDEHIHIALWPSVNENHQLASRHYAFEGRTYVVAVGQIMDRDATPESITLRPETPAQLLNGGSCVIQPDGQFMIQPIYNKPAPIVFEIPDKKALLAENLTMDVSGHYSRKDLFNFGVKKNDG